MYADSIIAMFPDLNHFLNRSAFKCFIESAVTIRYSLFYAFFSSNRNYA
jgi:hypothetical protein